MILNVAGEHGIPTRIRMGCRRLGRVSFTRSAYKTFRYFITRLLGHMRNMNCLKGTGDWATCSRITHVPTRTIARRRLTTWCRIRENRVYAVFYKVITLNCTAKCQISTCTCSLIFLQITTPIAEVYVLSLDN